VNPSTGSPPPSFGQQQLQQHQPQTTSTTSFRGVQSLPSTPNACRRPLSPPSLRQNNPNLIGGINQSSIYDQGIVAPPSGRVGFSDITLGPPLTLPPPPDSASQGMNLPSGQHFLFEGSGPVSESAILAGDLSSTEDGIGGRFRALQQFNHQQSRSLRYRSSAQPFAKLSTLVIVILALIIIGFIVLSPLFHYFM
jgi:hypothetical protein